MTTCEAPAPAPVIDLSARRQIMHRVRSRLLPFILAMSPNFKAGAIHELLCSTLDDFAERSAAGLSPRLIVNMPPRHGKSEVISRHFPAYFLGRFPDRSIISTSYSADLARRFSRDVQRYMCDPLYWAIFPDVYLPGTEHAALAGYGPRSPYTRSSDCFDLCGTGGSYRCAGVGGGITGMGADVLIIDDPLKDRKAANSATIRGALWDWYRSTASTRLTPGGGGVIVVQTRWHTGDLTGLLLEAQEHGGDAWTVLNFPAIAEKDEGWRKEGEALHPERYSLDQLQKKRRAIGEFEWASLYQGRPAPQGGGIIREDWLQYYDELPRQFDRLVVSWDASFKGLDTSDYVAGQVWGRSGPNFYLIDQLRGKWDFPATLKAMIALRVKHPRAARILIEDKANGPAIISVIRKHIPGIVPVTPKDSKEARLSAVSTFFETHNIFLPRPDRAPWIRDYVQELLQFPAGAHDDQVDATSQALNDLRTGCRITAANMLELAMS